jgi:3-oxoadipate enol-lactonase
VQSVNEAFERGDIDQAVELVTQLWTDGTDRTPNQVNPVARERIRAMTAGLFARPKVDAPMNLLEPLAIDRLAEIHVPALVVVGDRDLPRILDVADILLEQVPGARKLVIPDAAHHPNMEHPALFNQAVLDFLGALAD